MKILILGGGGMAGHMLRDYLAANEHEVWWTVRRREPHPLSLPLDLLQKGEVDSILERIQPEVVINATGILKDEAAHRLEEAIFVNSFFPHRLARRGKRYGFRLIQISTDCVFSGDRGGYTEEDLPDTTTIYGKTKSLGEVIDSTNLTIRTSIIGPELKPDGIGLFHWFMNQAGVLEGYRNVYWNGVTTLELGKAIQWSLSRPISGLVHLASPQKISKYTLLHLFKEVFDRNEITILPRDDLRSDKTLINSREDFTYLVPPYPVMLKELKDWMETQTERNYLYA
ncbi:dTDP-4-dehydrorhamnose reductase family protein [Desmospora profundinema]|uniref:dTDP-4-dehydrorhamnose reductase n=1 Tax=Desmospora profundinema TaxID=1571184 RepID=A0ABU1II11_9BACL|nr:SDR family oxidoreductase [Desmospora profundinema]MDR6224331.1 dTDP-4-dehydrorhamnose reductase [Desmospora profundinema]